MSGIGLCKKLVTRSNLVLTLVNKILFSKPRIVSYDRECAVSNIDKTGLILMVNRVDMTCPDWRIGKITGTHGTR
jgi:hypothetical protein